MCVFQHFSTFIIYEASCHHLRCLQPASFNSTNRKIGSNGVQDNSSLESLDINSTLFFNRTILSNQKVDRNWYDDRWSGNIIQRYPYYQYAGSLDWYILSTYAILEIILSLGTGNVKPTNLIEMVEVTLVMLVGYIFFAVWFLSFCFHMLTVVRRNRADYMFKVRWHVEIGWIFIDFILARSTWSVTKLADK